VEIVVELRWGSHLYGYREIAPLARRLAAVARLGHRVEVLLYHYDRLARHAFESLERVPTIKNCCYALRPALALVWLRTYKAPPPMDLPRLITVSPELEPAVAELVVEKAQALERAPTRRRALLDGVIARVLATLATKPFPGQPSGELHKATDALFRDAVLDEEIFQALL
jgi:uncharacterized protein